MTSVNTLLAPLLTPVITYLFLRTTVSVDVLAMFLSIIKVVIIPIALGFVINHFFGKFTTKVKEALPLVSVLAITLIVAAVVSHNAEQILTTGAVIFVVVILHNLLGYGCGLLLGKALRLPLAKKKALFPNLAMATVPGAIFSVWHNISGALLANIYRRMTEEKDVAVGVNLAVKSTNS